MTSAANNWQLDPTRPIGPELRRILRERIITTDLAPGARISESELGAAYGVSRQPVREAFIKLAEEGLIQVRPQRGTVVALIDVTAVLDARFVREAVEADIVKNLARAPNPAAVAELRRLITLQEGVEPGRTPAFIPLDDEFHKTLATAAGHERVWDIIESFKSHMDRVRYIGPGRFPTATLVDQHKRIVDKIEAGDPRGAEAVIRTHLREILNDLPAIQTAHPAFFEGEFPLDRPTAA